METHTVSHFQGCRFFEEKRSYRSRRSQMCFLKGVLKKFTIFIGKNLCWSLFITKLSLFKKLQHRCFPVKCEKFLRAQFFTEHLQWQLLKLLRNPNNPQSMGNGKFHEMGILTKITNLRNMDF